MKKIKAFIVFKKEPLVVKFISFHKSDADKFKGKEEEVMECVVDVPLPSSKKIENLVKK